MLADMSEAQLQTNVIRYINLQYPHIRYCASLGGQYQKYPSQRKKAVATGYVKGFPDLQICEARGGYFGMFLEIKEKGYATKDQKKWLEDLTERGYLAVCVKGLDGIISMIDSYMAQNQTIKRTDEKGK